MKQLLACLVGLLAVLQLGGCSSQGKSAPPPASVQAEARENGVLVTFPMEEGVEYWLFYAPSASLTSTNFISVAGGKVRTGAVSPVLVPLLENGTTYYFTINGRTQGGPGGTGTPLVSATPRLAGGTWSAAAAIPSADLRGTAFGGVFIAVGANGAMFSSPDGISWTALNFVVASDLNSVSFVNNVYMAVGAGGVLLASTDAATWTQQTTGTASDLQAVAGNGAGTYVVVGAGGAIIASTGGGGWTAASSGTSGRLYGASFGNGRFVAVGAGGVALTSADGLSWTAVSSQTNSDLRSVAYSASASLFVAVGAAGSLATSPDGITWTARAPISTRTMNAVIAGSQFVAVGNEGTILTSVDGIAWQAAASGTLVNLFGTAYGNSHYVAAGAAGTNLTAY